MKKYVEQIRSSLISLRTRIEAVFVDTDSDAKPITNQSLDRDRKEVIKKGRQHIVPVGTSRTWILIVSVVIGVLSLLSLSGYYLSQVYGQSSTSAFIYDASKIIPTPVGVLSDERVFYDEVLFQYQTALKVRNIQIVDSPEVKQEFMTVAFNKVFENLAIQQLAKQQEVIVTREEVASRVKLLEDTTGSPDKFEASLQADYGWSRSDFVREFEIQLLKEKLVPTSLGQVASQLSQDVEFNTVQSEFSSSEFPSSFNLDDAATQTSIPEVIIAAANELEDGTVSSEIPTELGTFFLNRDGGSIGVIHIGAAAADIDIDNYIANSQQFICLRSSGLSFEEGSIFKCIF